MSRISKAFQGVVSSVFAVPLRYGLVLVILLTLLFAATRIIPSVESDLRLLRAFQKVDVRGVALEASLQQNLEENRREFLRILLSDARSGEAAKELTSLRDLDRSIGLTNDSIVQLGVLPESSQLAFRDSWQRYVAAREQMLAAARNGDTAQARAIDSDLGKEAFVAVEQAVQLGDRDFATHSAARLASISRELSYAMKEVLISMGVRLFILFLLIWTDIRRVRAERRLDRATRELRSSEHRFQRAYDSASVGMGLFKLDGTLISTNKRAAQILGYSVQELQGRNLIDYLAPEAREDYLHSITSLPGSANESYQAERRVLRKDGSSAWVRNSVTLLKPEGEEGHYFFISEEITMQKEANDRLAYLANYDPIVNLPNRHSFEDLLKKSLRNERGVPTDVALLYVEIDSFDFLKGTFGRTVADEVLGELGVSLQQFRREGEIIGRLDDHVFAMVLPATAFDEVTLDRAGQMRDVFRRFSETGKHRIPLSASIGVAYSSERDSALWASSGQETSGNQAGAESLLKYARAAMLEARLRGGDSIYVADPALQQGAAQRNQIELALLLALREDEFRVVFQPQFEIASGSLVRFEALCRWTSAELGPIPPDRFIPIAEQTGLILEIGRRIMVDALREAKTWIDAGRRIGVAVNISPMQFMRPDFPQVVADILAETQFPPGLLELEITEGIFIRDLNLAVTRIRDLQRLGLSIALDDFGTGYSSLSYLQRMPIDAVKLDRSFVSDLTTDIATVSMVRSVLAMAEALHLRVVTEGVETEEQLDILRSLGCAEAQGYLLGRPESSEAAYARVLASPLSVLKAEVGVSALIPL